MNQNQFIEKIEQFIHPLSIDKLETVKQIVDKRIKVLEKEREESERNTTNEKFYDELFRGTLDLLTKMPSIKLDEAIKKSYDKLPFNVRWDEVTIDFPSYGCTPRCSDDDCWYHGNMDRLGEYDGTSFELVIDRSINFCEICVQNADMCDEESEAIDNEICEIELKFDQWNIKRLQSQPDCPRFIKMYQSDQLCQDCEVEDEESNFYFDTQLKKIICGDCLLKV